MYKLVSHLLPRTVRGRVSAVLNGTLFLLFVLFLIYDYRNDSADRLELKRTALEEQAQILMSGIHIKHAPVEICSYLAETRKQMEAIHADAHVVAAEIDGRFYQSGMLPEEEEVVAVRLRKATGTGSHFVEIGGRNFIVGDYHEGATVVYVTEDLRDVRAAIRADLKRHLVSVAIALLVGIVIINSTLWLAFHRPVSMLTSAVAEIGSGKLGLQIERIGAVEFDIVARAINNMSQDLAAAETTRHTQMQKARTIQDSLLPVRMVLDGVTIAHHFQSAEIVGGDYYDLLLLPNNVGLFCIADVTGHGVSAALVAGMVKICLHNGVERSSEPGELLRIVNHQLSSMDLPEMFVTMVLIRISLDPPSLEFAGAGHPPALLVDASQTVRELRSEGPMLGIESDFVWESQRESFERGSRLLLYTDGVTEASGYQGDQFGQARLKDLLLATRDESPTVTVQKIVERVTEFCGAESLLDDCTLVLIDCQQAPL